MSHYDVIVIGAGQGGGPLAGAFARAGRRTALVERSHVGGTCVNVGCTPTKTMIASARVAEVVRRAEKYGVCSGAVAVDLGRVRQRKQEIVERFRSGSERSLERAGVEVLRGAARFTGPRALTVTTERGAVNVEAELIFINTGLRPAIPPLRGLAGLPYLTSTSIMELTDLPERLLVLGGGYVGLEFAQMFRRFGSAVTILQREPQLLPREDGDVAEEIARLLAKDGIQVVCDVKVTSARGRPGDLTLEYEYAGDGASHAARGSHLLVATGRVPNTDELNLPAAGITTDSRGFVRVNERLETSVPGVYAIGDVTGGQAFTHVSYDDFRILRTNLLHGGTATTAGRLLVYTVFIDPQLGRVGMTEREATAAGRRFRVARLPMDQVARAIEVGETRGLMKALVDADSGAILGAAVLGVEGGEVAAFFQLAMMGNLPYTTLRDGMFSHPTLSESLNNLFMAMDRSQ